jgi:hypothetical protein
LFLLSLSHNDREVEEEEEEKKSKIILLVCSVDSRFTSNLLERVFSVVYTSIIPTLVVTVHGVITRWFVKSF